MHGLKARIGALLLLTACGGGTDIPEESAAALPPTTAEPAPSEVRQVLASSRIYYDLTRFDWYARGEPLVHDQFAYQPAGTPVAADLVEMERAGEYQGVEYYRRQGDGQSLYVPVYDGYWLAFRTVATSARVD